MENENPIIAGNTYTYISKLENPSYRHYGSIPFEVTLNLTDVKADEGVFDVSHDML